MSEFDYDRMIQIRASEWQKMEERIKEIEDQKAMLNTCIDGLKKRIEQLETKLASCTDLANTYCQEHGLPEQEDVRRAIEQLAWKITDLRERLSIAKEIRDDFKQLCMGRSE